MPTSLTIHQALEALKELDGLDIAVQGILHFTFENVSIGHFPVIERQEGYRSSIWLSVGAGGLGFDREVCRRWHGKRVVVEGIISAPRSRRGCGHMGLWPAELLARTLRRM